MRLRPQLHYGTDVSYALYNIHINCTRSLSRESMEKLSGVESNFEVWCGNVSYQAALLVKATRGTM